MSNKGMLYVVSAPSGAGKTSLVRQVLEQEPSVLLSVSHTTRPQRSSEIDGRDYNFVNPEQFDAMIEEQDFLEHANVFNYQYGTSASWVKQQLDQGIDIILEIDWQGAQQVRKLMPEGVLIFILPPSLEELRRRLETRGTDDQAVVDGRLAQAVADMSHYTEYDYVIINQDFDKAVNELGSIFLSQRLLVERQEEQQQDLLASLLSA